MIISNSLEDDNNKVPYYPSIGSMDSNISVGPFNYGGGRKNYLNLDESVQEFS
jgi:hypothetical protein